MQLFALYDSIDILAPKMGRHIGPLRCKSGVSDTVPKVRRQSHQNFTLPANIRLSNHFLMFLHSWQLSLSSSSPDYPRHSFNSYRFEQVRRISPAHGILWAHRCVARVGKRYRRTVDRVWRYWRLLVHIDVLHSLFITQLSWSPWA